VLEVRRRRLHGDDLRQDAQRFDVAGGGSGRNSAAELGDIAAGDIESEARRS
jgi:hypothetical protein